MTRKKQNADNLVPLFVRIPDNIKLRLDELALNEKMSTSKLTDMLIRSGLDSWSRINPKNTDWMKSN